MEDIFELIENADDCMKKNQSIDKNIIEELKVIKPMEAIVIKARYMPVKTKLTPSYKIDWGYEPGNEELPTK